MLFKLLINGEEKQVSSTTVQALILELELEGKRVAVELNKQIVPRSTYPEQKLSAGDQIELVHFVGGG